MNQPTTHQLETALAQFTHNRFVVKLPGGSFLDTDVVKPGDVVIFDRTQVRQRAEVGRMIDLAERYYELETDGGL